MPLSRRSFLSAAGLGGAGLWVTALTAAQRPASPLTVISAKRGKKYGSPTRAIEARDPVADVVLLLRVGGLSRDEFRQIDQDSIYVLAGSEHLPPNVVATRVVDGKAELIVVVVGPRSILEMTLVVNRYPPVPFKAEQTVVDELM